MESCPNDLKPYEIAHDIETNRKDMENWQLGRYIVDSIGSVFSTGHKYPKEPMFQIGNDFYENEYKESQEEVAIFEMKQRIKFLEKQGLPESPI